MLFFISHLIGNTFRLLDLLYRHDVLDPIRKKVEGGTPYIGTR